MKSSDSIVDEVRAAREALAKESGDNLEKIVEAARALGERTLKQAGASPEDRLRFLFKTVTARNPDAMELAELKTDLAEHLKTFQANPKRGPKFFDWPRLLGSPINGIVVGNDDGLSRCSADALRSTPHVQSLVASHGREDEAVDQRLHHALHDVWEIQSIDRARPEFDRA